LLLLSHAEDAQITSGASKWDRPARRASDYKAAILSHWLIKPKKENDMTKSDTTKTKNKAKADVEEVIGSDPMVPEGPVLEQHGQQKRPEKDQFCLQVDRQTKASYATYEAAEQAALAIKKAHPVVRVTIYDTVEHVNKLIELS
jgi:hypothetical protein